MISGTEGVDDAIVGPVTLLRVPAVETALAWVERGVNIEVTGTRVSGKTSFLIELNASLLDANWTVARVDGLLTLRDQPLEALAVAGVVEVGRPLPTIAAIVEKLTRDWIGERVVVLVDDIDCLDRASCGVLEALARRMTLRIVSTGPLRPPDPADRSVFRLPHPCAELTLRPWRFDELNGLLTSKFDQVVDPWLTGRIQQLSGGVPGFALALLEAAELESRVTLSDEVLYGTGTNGLWYEGLPRVVEDYIGPIPADERSALEQLSTWGPVPAAEACRLVTPDILRALEQRRLITVVRTGHHATIVVFPPLVAEYLNNHRGAVNSLLIEAEGAAAKERGDGTPRPVAGVASNEPAAAQVETSGALSRLLAAGREAEGERLSIEWAQRPNASTAAPLIAWLVGARGTHDQIDDVWARTRWEEGDVLERVTALMDRARWEAAGGKGPCAALDLLDQSRDMAGPLAPLLEHLALQIRVIGGDVPEYDESTIDSLLPVDDDLPAVRVSAWATRAYLALVTGRLEQATAAAQHIGIVPSRPRTVLIRSLALCAQGEVSAGLLVAQEALDAARAKHDIEGIHLAAYSAAFALQRLGRRQEATELLDMSLSLGRPRPDLEPIYQAQLALATRLAMQATENYRARSLARQTKALHLADGPLPGMSDTVLGLVPEAGLPTQVTPEVWERVVAMWDRRHRYAAISAGLWVTETVPDAERARIVSGWVREIGADSLVPSGEYVVALATRDANLLLSCAAGLLRTGWPSRAAVALSFAEEWFGASGEIDAADDAKTQWTELLATHPEVEMDLSLRRLPAAQLSDREREIVALIARGLSNRQIADELVLSVRTVENHIYRAFRKTRLTTRSQLGRLAL